MKSWLLQCCAYLSAFLCLGLATTVQAGPFTEGNLAVVVVGNGSTALSTGGAQVELREYTVTGTLVQTIALDSAGGNAFTLSGNDRTEGSLSMSGGYLTLAGYNAGPSMFNPATSTTIDRHVARVEISSGTVAYSGKLGSTFEGLSVKSAVTSDGNQMWISGNAGATGGIQYASTFAGTTSTQIADGTMRQVQINNGNLFVGGAAASPGRGVFQVGTGLPTTPAGLTAAFTQAGTQQYSSYYFTDLGSGNDWNSTGYDTLYAVNSTTGALEKWSFDGSTWSFIPTSKVSSTLTHVTGFTYGSSVVLYLTSGGTSSVASQIFSLVDTAGHGAPITGNLTSIISLGNNTSGYAFRGIAAVPEPASLALCAMAGVGFAGFVVRRRRKNVSAPVV